MRERMSWRRTWTRRRRPSHPWWPGRSGGPARAHEPPRLPRGPRHRGRRRFRSPGRSCAARAGPRRPRRSCAPGSLAYARPASRPDHTARGAAAPVALGARLRYGTGRVRWAAAFFLVVLVASRDGQAGTPARPNLILATTTSTQDSGLLDVLVPGFEEIGRASCRERG